MYITDLEGNHIDVTNIEKAIALAECFVCYSHKDKSYIETDKRLQAYWQDMLDKVEKIYEETKHQNNQTEKP